MTSRVIRKLKGKTSTFCTVLLLLRKRRRYSCDVVRSLGRSDLPTSTRQLSFSTTGDFCLLVFVVVERRSGKCGWRFDRLFSFIFVVVERRSGKGRWRFDRLFSFDDLLAFHVLLDGGCNGRFPVDYDGIVVVALEGLAPLAEPGLGDALPGQLGTLQVEPGQAAAALDHGSASERAAAVTGHLEEEEIKLKCGN